MSLFGDDGAGTDEAIRAPRIGDRYTEMFAFDLFVIHVDGDIVATLECSRGEGVILPRDGVLRVQTQSEFQERLSYGSSVPGYWVRLAERNFNVGGWYEFAASQSGNADLSVADGLEDRP